MQRIAFNLPLIAALSLLLAACSTSPPQAEKNETARETERGTGRGTERGTERAETIFALTAHNRLISFNAGRPGVLAGNQRIRGLQAGEALLGMDFRPANGKLYALGSSQRLYVLDPASGAATPVGTAPLAIALVGRRFGFNFNPVVDKIRLVSDKGENMRVDPDKGAIVDSDPNTDGVQIDKPLAYAKDDGMAGKVPQVTAVAYTNSMPGVKATTNFAIDPENGLLLTQGTREGLSLALSPVSPNTGQLFTVGPLGTPASKRAAFDIGVVGNMAFLTLDPADGPSRLYALDLNTGAATLIGTIAGGEAVVALSVAPPAK